MQKDTLFKGMQIINSFLPNNYKIPNATIINYYEVLKDFSDQEFIDAINLMLSTEKKLMWINPAMIIEYIKQVSDNYFKIESMFESILLDVIKFGNKMPPYDDRIKNTIFAIGGWNKLRYMNDNEKEKIKTIFVQEYLKQQKQLKIKNDKNYEQFITNITN